MRLFISVCVFVSYCCCRVVLLAVGYVLGGAIACLLFASSVCVFVCFFCVVSVLR